ncbi:hypothetical protein [Actinophytocola sp.]|uniref:hypothetical protein n=1 Tax=Actinophytocola sp. TaxID=1872138 RepID=UPI002D3DDDAD|nr:hypothetical protein [Actinophytocola sp.]HYQ69052.1 hypothetical protein [Actinophytocola sp.]
MNEPHGTPVRSAVSYAEPRPDGLPAPDPTRVEPYTCIPRAVLAKDYAATAERAARDRNQLTAGTVVGLLHNAALRATEPKIPHQERKSA